MSDSRYIKNGSGVVWVTPDHGANNSRPDFGGIIDVYPADQETLDTIVRNYNEGKPTKFWFNGWETHGKVGKSGRTGISVTLGAIAPDREEKDKNTDNPQSILSPASGSDESFDELGPKDVVAV